MSAPQPETETLPNGKESKEFTKEEVAKHNVREDLWVIVDAKVFDLTRFADLHPGGLAVLLDEDVAGQDATDVFFGLHKHEILLRPQYARLQIGTIRGEKERIKAPVPGQLSKVPYAEPTWLADGYFSPYFSESHRRWQKEVRKFFDEIIAPEAWTKEEEGKRVSDSVIKAMADTNLIAARMGPGKHLQGRKLLAGVKPEEFDYFHELIIHQETGRLGTRGYADGLLGGSVIGLPPVLNFGKEPLRSRVIDEVFSGKKFISLAISEAFAGSDVAGLKTTARKTEDGKSWIVNGTKKWITNGHFSDYFTVGCRTDGGFTVLLVERTDGVETKAIKTSYSPAAGTAYITFDNVKVPIENTLGRENDGLRVILSNFNHERWAMVCGNISTQRNVLQECLKWVNQRQVAGKPLAAQAVIRAKLATMMSRVESLQSWLENITYQMSHMDYKQQSNYLAGQIALIKMSATQGSHKTAEDAVQIFGGRGITRSGMGRLIEHYHRTVPFDSILGGAEDVLGDLGVRQALRKMPKNARL